MHRSDEVGEIDSFDATNTYKQVFVEIGHTHDFVGYDLADREDQGWFGEFWMGEGVAFGPDKGVELGWPGKIYFAIGCGAYLRRSVYLCVFRVHRVEEFK